MANARAEWKIPDNLKAEFFKLGVNESARKNYISQLDPRNKIMLAAMLLTPELPQGNPELGVPKIPEDLLDEEKCYSAVRSLLDEVTPDQMLEIVTSQDTVNMMLPLTSVPIIMNHQVRDFDIENYRAESKRMTTAITDATGASTMSMRLQTLELTSHMRDLKIHQRAQVKAAREFLPMLFKKMMGAFAESPESNVIVIQGDDTSEVEKFMNNLLNDVDDQPTELQNNLADALELPEGTSFDRWLTELVEKNFTTVTASESKQPKQKRLTDSPSSARTVSMADSDPSAVSSSSSSSSRRSSRSDSLSSSRRLSRTEPVSELNIQGNDKLAIQDLLAEIKTACPDIKTNPIHQAGMAVHYEANVLIKNIEKRNDKNKAHEYNSLRQYLRGALDLLSDPTDMAKIQQLQFMAANSSYKKSSGWQKFLGALSILTGVVILALGFAGVPYTAGGSVLFGMKVGGSLIAAGGAALFGAGSRKELSEHMSELAEKAEKLHPESPKHK